MLVGEPTKQRRVCNLAAEHQQKRKKGPRDIVDPGGSRLPPARGCPTVQKWHGTKNTDCRDKSKTIVHRELPIGRTSKMRRRKGPEWKTGIKDPRTRRQLRLQIERTTEEFNMNALGLEFLKRANDVQQVTKDQELDLVECSTPSEKKKELHVEEELVM
jgi:hypothetical protein